MFFIFMLRFLLTTEVTIPKFFERCQQFFLPYFKDTGIRGARTKIPAAKKSLTGNNQFNTLASRKNQRVATWRSIFQTIFLIIIGIILMVPVCLGCAEKIQKIQPAF